MQSEEQSESSFGDNAYKNFMELFFLPEINRRKKNDLLDEDFTLCAAQAILFPNGEQNFRLNEEVVAELKLKKGIDNNVEGYCPLSSEVDSIRLREPELSNCGHVTIIHFEDGCKLSFDFVYNRQIVSEHLQAANEFLVTSKYALDHGLLSAFTDNAFSAMELLAKANLLLEVNESAKEKSNHKFIKAAINIRFRNSQVEFDLKKKEVYNRLSDLRSKARYLDGKMDMGDLEASSIFETIQSMYNELQEWIG